MKNYSSFRDRFVSNVCLLLGAVLFSSFGQAQAPGYWHTAGNQILDADGKPVRIAGVNWYGFEGPNAVVQGLWAQDYHVILNSAKRNGYNTIRLPFSNQMAEGLIYPSGMSFSNGAGPINTDLQQLDALHIMDKIVGYAGEIGLHIILDDHRSEQGSGTETGFWYNDMYPEQKWIQDWKDLAHRYLNNPTVIGVDLRNEPHHDKYGNGSCWACGDPASDWMLAAERGGNAVLSVNPNLLIFVEGTDVYNGDYNWWGGNLEGVQDHPVVLTVPNRVVYSPHEYGPAEYKQPWFYGSATPATLAARYTRMWGYISQWNIAPIWVGEFGTSNATFDNDTAITQDQWFQGIVKYLQENLAVGWSYWALNGSDKYGLLDANYDSTTPADPLKQQFLAAIQAPIVNNALRFVPVTPCRIADTRTPDGSFGGPLVSGGSTRTFALPGTCGLPANAQAYSLNVTVVPSKTLNYLTIWPDGQAQPFVSTLNSYDGRIKANAAIVPAGANGSVDVFVTEDTHVILDVNGYFVRAAENPALAFYPLTPCRVADTRVAGPLGSPYLTATQSRDFPILLSSCGIPMSAKAYSLNFTAVPRGGRLGYLTTWPTGLDRPTVSTLNSTTGAVTANAAIVPSGDKGDISVYAQDDTDLVIDVNGYFATPGTGGLSFYSVAPCRVSDSRNTPGSTGITGAAAIQVLGGTCDVGSSPAAYVMNATVVPQAPPGKTAFLDFLTLYPDGGSQPLVSTLNARDGAITSNMAIVPTGTSGVIDAFLTDRTHLIMDLSGYFAP